MFAPSKQLIIDNCCLALGKEFAMVHSVSLQATHLVVFASFRILDRISKVKSKYVSLGFKGKLGNKGAVQIKMTLGTTRLCFISAHLHSGQNVVDKRNSDLNVVISKLIRKT